jgi:hypothetical protein
MPQITYAKSRVGYWVALLPDQHRNKWITRAIEEEDIVEEHMRLIAILNVAENNSYIPGVGQRSDDALPVFIRYILDVS